MCNTTEFEIQQRALDGSDPEGQTTLDGGIVIAPEVTDER